jgi:ATP:ADP antiporter, AAA family
MGERKQASLKQTVLLAALGSAAVIGHLVIAKAARDALFLSTFDVDRLPAATIAAALASLASALVMARAMSRRGPVPVLTVALAASALLHGAEWSLLRMHSGAAAILLYLHVALFGATTLSAFWSVVTEAFDPHTAKRQLSRIAMGGTLGGAVGGVLAWQVGGSSGVPALLMVLALLDVASAALVPRLGRPSRPQPPVAATERSGLALLARRPYLRQLALVVGACALVSALLDYVIGARVVAVLDADTSLVTFFALFHAAVGIGALIVQLAATRPVLERFGLATAVGLLPATIIGFGALAVAVPSLWSAVLLRGFEGIVASSLYRAGYELGYTPLAPAEKRPTKTLIDVGFDRIGTIAGGAIALVAIALVADDPARVLTLIAMVAAAVALLAALRLHPGYVQALATSLESGAIRLSEGDLVDATTRRTLAETTALDRRALLAEIERRRDPARASSPALDPLLERAGALRSGDPDRVRAALAEPLPLELVPIAADLLADDVHSRRALAALRAIAPSAAGSLVDALLDDRRSVVVRRRIPRVLEVVDSERSVFGLLDALACDERDVRHQSVLALLRLRTHKSELQLAPRRIVEAARCELERWRGEQDPEVLERGLELFIRTLSLLLERDPLELAHSALYGEDEALRGTALEYLENVLPESLRHDAMALFVRARRAGFAAAGAAPPSARRRQQRELVEELMRSRELLIDRRRLSDPRELG